MDAPNAQDFAALAARLDELSQVCARLSQENAELRTRMSQITPETGPSAGRAVRKDRHAAASDGMVSRRKMGKALGAAAAGVVGVVALAEASASPAAAASGDNVVAGNLTNAESPTTVQYDGSSGLGVVFLANDTDFTNSQAGYSAAVGGWAGNGHVVNGVYGYSKINGGYGVVGASDSGPTVGGGVYGIAYGSGTVGVTGYNGTGTGISGSSGTGTGISGSTDSGNDHATAIVGTVTSTHPAGYSAGVRGVNNSTTGNGIGVWGSQAGSGWGVMGSATRGIGVYGTGGTGTGVLGSGATGVEGAGTTGVLGTGVTGVRATGSTAGVAASGMTAVHGSGSGNGSRGGAFSGAAAQVQLIPGSLHSHPTSGKRGDLYVDSQTRLWFCKTTGSTAVWHQIA
jgi:hypothetical protein